MPTLESSRFSSDIIFPLLASAELALEVLMFIDLYLSTLLFLFSLFLDSEDALLICNIKSLGSSPSSSVWPSSPLARELELEESIEESKSSKFKGSFIGELPVSACY
jgi:hypothetical protein